MQGSNELMNRLERDALLEMTILHRNNTISSYSDEILVNEDEESQLESLTKPGYFFTGRRYLDLAEESYLHLMAYKLIYRFSYDDSGHIQCIVSHTEAWSVRGIEIKGLESAFFKALLESLMDDVKDKWAAYYDSGDNPEG